jgi:hypothetical protein
MTRSAGALALALTVVFLTVGLPRRVVGDADPIAGRPAVGFARLCREHGGTPRPAPGSRDTARLCTVRYGRRSYVMDAITPRGFDAATARFQLQGCEEEAARERASTGTDRAGKAFVFHPETGVCERRP